MKKKLILTIISMITAAGLAFGADEAFTFNDGTGAGNSGTYSPGSTLSIEVTLSWTGYDARGFQLWFATSGANGGTLASFLTITGRIIGAGSPFPDPNQTPSFPFAFSEDQGGGEFETPDPSDLGYTANAGDAAAGSYLVTTVSFAISASALPGTYTFQSDTTGGHASLILVGFGENPMPATSYTITIVPEPSTFALLGLAAAGLGLVAYRRRMLKV